MKQYFINKKNEIHCFSFESYSLLQETEANLWAEFLREVLCIQGATEVCSGQNRQGEIPENICFRRQTGTAGLDKHSLLLKIKIIVVRF